MGSVRQFHGKIWKNEKNYKESLEKAYYRIKPVYTVLDEKVDSVWILNLFSESAPSVINLKKKRSLS